MNNISLTQATAFVVVVCLASSFVNADDVLADDTEKNIVVHAQSTEAEIISEVVQAAEVVQSAEESNDKFTFTSLDADQNGKLNQQEVVAGKNEWLVKTFNQIDNNADKLLTEQELVDFATHLAMTHTAMK